MVLGNHPGSKKPKRSGTLSSVRVHHLYASRSLTGRSTLRQEALNATAIQKRQVEERVEHKLRQDAMSVAERDTLKAIRNNTANDSGSGSNVNLDSELDGWEMDVNAILAGEETLDISYAGGEFGSVMEIADNLLGSANR